jgi:hypothetical protein
VITTPWLSVSSAFWTLRRTSSGAAGRDEAAGFARVDFFWALERAGARRLAAELRGLVALRCRAVRCAAAAFLCVVPRDEPDLRAPPLRDDCLFGCGISVSSLRPRRGYRN